jgi:hypothetical protein
VPWTEGSTDLTSIDVRLRTAALSLRLLSRHPSGTTVNFPPQAIVSLVVSALASPPQDQPLACARMGRLTSPFRSRCLFHQHSFPNFGCGFPICDDADHSLPPHVSSRTLHLPYRLVGILPLGHGGDLQRNGDPARSQEGAQNTPD